MAACSSPTTGPISSPPFSTESINTALGLLSPPREYIPSLKPLEPRDLIKLCDKIDKLIRPLLETIFDYFKTNPKGVSISENGFNLSPSYFEKLEVPVIITGKKEIILRLPVNGLINSLRPIPEEIAERLQRICYIYSARCLDPLTPDGKVALLQKTQTLLEPHYDAIIAYFRRLQSFGHQRSLHQEVETLPIGLQIARNFFNDLTHSVIVGEDRKTFVVTGCRYRDTKSKDVIELIHPSQGLLNKINAHFEILSSIQLPHCLVKFPTDAEDINAALLGLREIVAPVLNELKQLAHESPCGISFSRRQYRKLPFSLCLTRSGDIYVFARKTIGKGAYSKIQRIIHLETANNLTITVPLDNEVDFYKELSLKLRFQDRLKGKPGFLFYLENYVQDSWGLGTPKGLIAEEYPFNGWQFLIQHISSKETEERRRLRFTFIKNLIEAVETLHEQEIYHLDLTSQNILVKPNGEIAIIDFAFAYDPLQQNKVDGGNYCTRPPEIPVSEGALQHFIDSKVKTILTEIISKGSWEWNKTVYQKIDAPFLPEIVKKDMCRAYDIWSLGCIIYLAIYCCPIPGSCCLRDKQTNVRESDDAYFSRRTSENANLFKTRNIVDYLKIKPEAVPENQSLQWLIKMFNLDYLQRPTIQEIKEEFLKIYADPLHPL